MSQVLGQTDESEIVPLSTDAHREFWARLRQAKGGDIRVDTEPSDDQIAALKVRVVDCGLSPYADFGLFTDFQLRFTPPGESLRMCYWASASTRHMAGSGLQSNML